MKKIRVPPTSVKTCRSLNNPDFYRFIQTNHPGLVPFYERLYVLVPDGGAPTDWRALMNDAQYEIHLAYGFVIAFAFVEQIDDTMGNLVWLESRIRGYGFGTYLRRRLRHTFVDVLPTYISKESASYWNKELGFDKEHEEGYSLHEYMTQLCGDLKPHFNWNALLDVN